jgi:hypothetical protein
MSKSLRVLAVIVVFALMGSIVFAYAPVIKPLPNIYIGDNEDSPGTIDNNLFRFSDAINLDDYVDDEDSTISELVWSFIEGTGTDLLINGISQLADPGDAVNADILGKDIRSVKATTDFWDESNCTQIGTYPDLDPDPALPFASASTLNEVVTFFCSDGINVDSGDTIVQAVDNDFDGVSMVTIFTEVFCDGFEGTTDGWFYQAFPGVGYTGATSTTNANAIGLVTDDTTNRFAWWRSADVSGIVQGDLYKIAWELSTNQTNQDLVPSTRCRVGDATLNYAYTMAVESNGTTNPNAPTSTPKIYNQYVEALTGDDMQLYFDVYDFSNPGDFGTMWLEEACLYSASTGDLGAWTDETVPPPSAAGWGWAPATGFSLPSSGTTGGLQMTTTNADANHFGFWFTGGLTFTADQLYLASWTVTSSSTTPPWTMVRVSSDDLQLPNRLTVYTSGGGIQPDADGETYPLYFTPPESIGSVNTYTMAFELGDFEGDKGGTLTLTDITVQRQDIPE